MKAFDVLYEDNHLLIVNKRPGILVQGDATGDEPLVEAAKRYIAKKYNKPGEVFLGVVHRLDRPVSGVVVLARTSKALQRMNALFRQKETRKTYYAICDREPANHQGTLISWLIKDEQKNKTKAFPAEVPGSQRAELSYSVVSSRENFSLLEVRPITGRPHQIRIQLATMGCPIIGDLKYGAPAANEDASICLHARSLEFVHPVKKETLKVSAPMPALYPWRLFSDFANSL